MSNPSSSQPSAGELLAAYREANKPQPLPHDHDLDPVSAFGRPVLPPPLSTEAEAVRRAEKEAGSVKDTLQAIGKPFASVFRNLFRTEAELLKDRADAAARVKEADDKIRAKRQEALSLLTRRDHLRNRIVDTGSEIKRLRTKAASIEHKKQRVARNVERCLQLNNPDKLSWPGLAAEGPMLAALDFAAAEIARRLALAVEADRRAHEENEEFLRKHADDLALVEA